MHRSASTSRASDEFVINISPQMKGSPGLKMAVLDQLPTYDPLSEVSKKESSRLKWAENAVHFIPLVLIVCGFILWFFSRPGTLTTIICQQTLHMLALPGEVGSWQRECKGYQFWTRADTDGFSRSATSGLVTIISMHGCPVSLEITKMM
ncbi:hypothetical protein AAC387_Pa02g1322 [Persea americana]